LADADLLEIFDYFGGPATPLSRRFLSSLRATLDRLCDFPGFAPMLVTSNPRLAGVRKYTVNRFRKYLIFYRTVDDILRVERVFHGARDWGRLLGIDEDA